MYTHTHIRVYTDHLGKGVDGFKLFLNGSIDQPVPLEQRQALEFVSHHNHLKGLTTSSRCVFNLRQAQAYKNVGRGVSVSKRNTTTSTTTSTTNSTTTSKYSHQILQSLPWPPVPCAASPSAHPQSHSWLPCLLFSLVLHFNCRKYSEDAANNQQVLSVSTQQSERATMSASSRRLVDVCRKIVCVGRNYQ